MDIKSESKSKSTARIKNNLYSYSSRGISRMVSFSLSSKKKEESEYKKSTKEFFKNVIIDIHGGGFMATSVSFHEPYLRRFCNKLQTAFFCIDYRLAPLVKYPENLHDVIKAYLWILEFVEKVIGVEIENLILFGDSAGAGLAAALVNWLIVNKQRKPDLLILCYGALDLDNTKFCRGSAVALYDRFLNFSACLAVTKCYVPKEADIKNDYYINPAMAPDWILKDYPKTRVLACENDPLFDGQIRFSRRMQLVNSDIRLWIFRDIQHGLLNVSTKSFLPSKIFNDEIIKLIKDQLMSKENAILRKLEATGNAKFEKVLEEVESEQLQSSERYHKPSEHEEDEN